MIILGIAAAVVVLPVAAILAIGARLPVAHRASASATYGRPPEEVWRTLIDFDEHPSWRRGLRAVEHTGDTVKEISTKGEAMTFETSEDAEHRRMTRRIADRNLPFGGSWTFQVAPSNGGSRVTITEDGEVYNVVFRFVSRYIMGHHATIKAFLEDLGRKFDETTEVAVERS